MVAFFDPNKQAEVNRLRRMAEVMTAQNQQPQQTEVVGGYAVKQSPLAGLAKAFGQGFAGYQQGKAEQLQEELNADRQKLMAEAIAKMGSDPQGAAMTLMQDPEQAGAGMKLYADALNANRQLQAQDTRFDNAMKAAAVRSGQVIYDPQTGALRENPTGGRKPLPVGALKMVGDSTDALGIAGGITKDLQQIKTQLDNNQLNLGPIQNIKSRAKNFAGQSDENSRNFATFQSSLEKLRNDSLRLNKGVQTEGDAQRAWDEIIANINDEEFVKKRLNEVININQRAAQLQQAKIDMINQNYGMPAQDLSGFQNLQPAIGGFQPVTVDQMNAPQPSMQAQPPMDTRGLVLQRLTSQGMSPQDAEQWLKSKGM